MTEKEILNNVLREMTAIGRGWRSDWSDFDGRTLRAQLDDIKNWACDNPTEEYTQGTEFEENQHGY